MFGIAGLISAARSRRRPPPPPNEAKEKTTIFASAGPDHDHHPANYTPAARPPQGVSSGRIFFLLLLSSRSSDRFPSLRSHKTHPTTMHGRMGEAGLVHRAPLTPEVKGERLRTREPLQKSGWELSTIEVVKIHAKESASKPHSTKWIVKPTTIFGQIAKPFLRLCICLPKSTRGWHP